MLQRPFPALLSIVLCGCAAASVEDGGSAVGSTGSAPTAGSSTGQSAGGSSTGASDKSGPRISCLPTSLSFGDVTAYESATLPVTCTNVGSAGSTPALIIDPPLASPRVFMSQFDPSDFPNPSAGLEPGQSARIFVGYRPTTTSVDQGTLDIRNNAGEDLRIPLAGQGLPPLPCQFAVSTSEIDFGSVQLGNVSQVMSFEIQNVGAGLCALEDLQIRYDATSSFHILSTSIAADPYTGRIVIPPSEPDAGSDLTVSLDFAPTGYADALAAEVVVTVVDPSGTSQPVSVSLSGVAPYPDESNCLRISSALWFGDVVWPEDDGGVLCTAAPAREITFFDACEASVRILSFDLQSTSGDAIPQFTIDGPEPPLSLYGGLRASSYEVSYQVAFNPTSSGQHTAQLTVAHNSQHSAAEIDTQITLSGQTIPPPTETDTFTATESLTYPLDNTPFSTNGMTVTINRTRVAQLDGPNQPDWTYDATANAIDFTFRVGLKAGDAIGVTYPIGCE